MDTMTQANWLELFPGIIPEPIDEESASAAGELHPITDHAADELADERASVLDLGRFPMADAECVHGRLPHDRSPDCGCWTSSTPAPATPADERDRIAAAAATATTTEGS